MCNFIPTTSHHWQSNFKIHFNFSLSFLLPLLNSNPSKPSYVLQFIVPPWIENTLNSVQNFEQNVTQNLLFMPKLLQELTKQNESEKWSNANTRVVHHSKRILSWKELWGGEGRYIPPKIQSHISGPKKMYLHFYIRLVLVCLFSARTLGRKSKKDPAHLQCAKFDY